MPSENINKKNKSTQIMTFSPNNDLHPDMMTDPNDKEYGAKFTVELELGGKNNSLVIATITFKNKSKFSKKFHDNHDFIKSLYDNASYNIIKAFNNDESLDDILIVIDEIVDEK